jgi:diphthamide synthase (EF-2-diphthine--ammonia ligase)
VEEKTQSPQPLSASKKGTNSFALEILGLLKQTMVGPFNNLLELDSYMFQTIGVEITDSIEKCCDIPLIKRYCLYPN